MRLARPQFTIRLLMVFVAIVGATLAVMMTGSRLTRRAERFRQRARLLLAQERNMRRFLDLQLQTIESHKSVRNMYADIVHKMDKSGPWRGAAQYDRAILQIELEAQFSRELVTYYWRLKQKYERAAFRPWESVAPDPQMPSPNNRPAIPVRPPSPIAR
jgi:hypothetical protein